jgi:hypothetical protein
MTATPAFFESTERRLITRMQEYWDYLRQERDFPSAADVNPVELDEDWCDCFVMFPSAEPGETLFKFIGPRLLENARLPEDWARAAPRSVTDCPGGSMIARSVQYVAHVIEQRRPVTVTEAFAEDGEEVRMRAILFPLSSDGQTVDAILGAANCARIADVKRK